MGVLLGLKPGGILRNEQVMDCWSIRIENGQGKADEVFQDTENFITETKAPSLKISRRKMAPGFIRGALGLQRDFLEVKNRMSMRLKPLSNIHCCPGLWHQPRCLLVSDFPIHFYAGYNVPDSLCEYNTFIHKRY